MTTNVSDSHSKKTKSIIINALPKSGSLYIVLTLAKTLSYTMFNNVQRIVTHGLNHSHVDSKAVQDFIMENGAIAQVHIAPVKYNLDILYYSGLTKFVVLFRDPRDALVSWAHHLERKDVNVPWVQNMQFASGMISRDYYKLSWEEKLQDLVDNYYSIELDWIREWVNVESHNIFDILFVTYEEFISNKEIFIKKILHFFGLLKDDTSIIWPGESKRIDGDINLGTHLRRGVVGSHTDELTRTQVNILNTKSDKYLFDRFNWPL